jgi:hypothetical protein
MHACELHIVLCVCVCVCVLYQPFELLTNLLAFRLPAGFFLSFDFFVVCSRVLCVSFDVYNIGLFIEEHVHFV